MLTDDQLFETYITAIAHGLNQCFITLLEKEMMRRSLSEATAAS
ncbi:sporulation histidine kinase inhibitor Sda [Edaphobacillus lindanitolerans]|nr:sporulation histidine kinase inhibitor Sda [Edaphobacillus lindanitolerans]